MGIIKTKAKEYVSAEASLWHQNTFPQRLWYTIFYDIRVIDK